MIAIFFLVLRKSNTRDEMRWWTYGWFGRAAAMGITLVFWYTQPPASVHSLVFAPYLVAKNVYVWLLLRGALEFQSRRPRAIEARTVVPLILAFSVVAIFTVTTRDRLGLASQAVVALAFGAGAWSLARAGQPAARWIVIALSGRALLGLVEAVAYGVNVIGLAPGEQIADAFLVPAAGFSRRTTRSTRRLNGCSRWASYRRLGPRAAGFANRQHADARRRPIFAGSSIAIR